MKCLISANDAADFLIYFCRQHGDYLTNLKLQKLLYFAQGWYLAFFNVPLFSEEIQAWIHGPVIPAVYSRFKEYSYNPITEDIEEPNLANQIKEHLIEVFEYYGKYSAFDLENISHKSQPWMSARDNLQPDEASTNKINLDDMKNYYKSLAEE